MGAQPHHSVRDELLAYHMGWLDRDDMARIERLIASDPEWAAVHQELAQATEPLSSWNALPVVEHIEEHLLRHVELHERGARRAASPSRRERATLDPVLDHIAAVIRWPFSLREFIATAACIAILFVIVVPSLARSSAVARRAMCLSHLHHIGSAQSAYADHSAGWLPYASTNLHAYAAPQELSAPISWLRERTAGINRLRNSRHRFLLMKHGHVPDGYAFICPSDAGGVVMRFDSLEGFDDFPEPANCSYDSQIMLRSRQVGDLHPELVVYSDRNPLFDAMTADAPTPGEANSHLHQRLGGQNVLRADGAGHWARTPNTGVQNDNIWRIGQRRNYTGTELPVFSTDSFMIP